MDHLDHPYNIKAPNTNTYVNHINYKGYIAVRVFIHCEEGKAKFSGFSARTDRLEKVVRFQSLHLHGNTFGTKLFIFISFF